ncbi:hypothetical protein V8C86DRAFT_1192964 [Haematococcus lacustris]
MQGGATGRCCCCRGLRHGSGGCGLGLSSAPPHGPGLMGRHRPSTHLPTRPRLSSSRHHRHHHLSSHLAHFPGVTSRAGHTRSAAPLPLPPRTAIAGTGPDTAAPQVPHVAPQVPQVPHVAQLLPRARLQDISQAAEALAYLALGPPGAALPSHAFAAERLRELRGQGAAHWKGVLEALVGYVTPPQLRFLTSRQRLRCLWAAAVLHAPDTRPRDPFNNNTVIGSDPAPAQPNTADGRALAGPSGDLGVRAQATLALLQGGLPLLSVAGSVQALHAAALLCIRPYPAWRADWELAVLRKGGTLSATSALQMAWALDVTLPRPCRLSASLTSALVAALSRHAGQLSREQLSLARHCLLRLFPRLRSRPLQQLIADIDLRLQHM